MLGGMSVDHEQTTAASDVTGGGHKLGRGKSLNSRVDTTSHGETAEGARP